MAFAESLKVAVRKRAHHACCLCHKLGVEVHHIIPEAENGPDTEDNAAPLCPACHEIYGANPVKRKFIREVRDTWFEICANRYASEATQVTDLIEKLTVVLGRLITIDDLEKLTVRSSTVQTSSRDESAPTLNKVYSFENEELVHPRIVKELIGWLSDPAAAIVAVDLCTANRSNRFFGDFTTSISDGRLWVECDDEGTGWFRYAHLATSPCGVHMVECYEGGGGSGIFGHVALLSFEEDRTAEGGETRPRVILKTLGNVGLGDRYQGEVVYKDGILIVSGEIQGGEKRVKAIAVS
jgi:hypothetical protein